MHSFLSYISYAVAYDPPYNIIYYHRGIVHKFLPFSVGYYENASTIRCFTANTLLAFPSCSFALKVIFLIPQNGFDNSLRRDVPGCQKFVFRILRQGLSGDAADTNAAGPCRDCPVLLKKHLHTPRAGKSQIIQHRERVGAGFRLHIINRNVLDRKSVV